MKIHFLAILIAALFVAACDKPTPPHYHYAAIQTTVEGTTSSHTFVQDTATLCVQGNKIFCVMNSGKDYVFIVDSLKTGLHDTGKGGCAPLFTTHLQIFVNNAEMGFVPLGARIKRNNPEVPAGTAALLRDTFLVATVALK